MPRAEHDVFLTTERMEQEEKTDNILAVCGIPESKADYLLSHHEDIAQVWEA